MKEEPTFQAFGGGGGPKPASCRRGQILTYDWFAMAETGSLDDQIHRWMSSRWSVPIFFSSSQVSSDDPGTTRP
jgi:hypothetical protein